MSSRSGDPGPRGSKRSLSESSTSSSNTETDAKADPPYKIPKKTDLMGGGMRAFKRRESQASTGSSSYNIDDDVGQPKIRSSSSELDEESGFGSFNSNHLSMASDVPRASSLNEPGTYSSMAQKMMSKMGFQQGKGLGKSGQGIVEPVGLSKQRGRRGLGLILKGLEDENVHWDPSQEHVAVTEEVRWMPELEDERIPSLKEFTHKWLREGPRKTEIDDELHFCDKEVLSGILKSKTIFDQLEPQELRKARTRSNPFETIRGGMFQNRAAMKMANMDAVFDFIFTNPKSKHGQPLVGGNQLLYFADVCAGPGGFSEYILWRKRWRAKGFGFTIKGPCDFKLEDFHAGPAETFEPHYGVGGREGDGNIFNQDNVETFRRYVLDHTDDQGVHIMMADGGFSVEGQENIQEILSKQLYLCQFRVALGIVRTGGHFVCKLFDLFTPFSAGLVYLMRLSFEEVCLHKPNTSRPANSERYIICKWKRPNIEAVYDYMQYIDANLHLDHLGNSDSKVDITEVVPLEKMKQDSGFLEYLTESNNLLGEWQIVGLSKIAAFCKDTSLVETRQAEIKQGCLQYWKVPNEVRRAPSFEKPEVKIERLTLGRVEFLARTGESLTPHNFLKLVMSVFDWKFILSGSNRDSVPTFFFSLGTTKIFRRNDRSGRWEKMEDNLKCELPSGTLVYGELVTEIKGEKMGSRKVSALHIIDVAFIGEEDLRDRDFITRNEQAKLLAKAVNKYTRTDYILVRAKDVFSLERLAPVVGGLKHRMFKGTREPRLTFDVERNDDTSPQDIRYFVPTGLELFPIVSEPFTIAFSRTHKKKYWFDKAKGSSVFECPPTAVMSFNDSFAKRLRWVWADGVIIDPHLRVREDPNLLQLSHVYNLIQKQMPQ